VTVLAFIEEGSTPPSRQIPTKLVDIFTAAEEAAFRLGDKNRRYKIGELNVSTKIRRNGIVTGRVFEGWRYALLVKHGRGPWRMVRVIGMAGMKSERDAVWNQLARPHGLSVDMNFKKRFPRRFVELAPTDEARLAAEAKAKAKDRQRAKLDTALRAWQRKAKLAQTKVKQYTSKLKRLNRNMAVLP